MELCLKLCGLLPFSLFVDYAVFECRFNAYRTELVVMTRRWGFSSAQLQAGLPTALLG